MSVDKTAIRDASTVIVVRDRDSTPKVLMGQRGAKAAFFPNKFVFPGGAVDAEDAQVPFAAPLPPLCAARLYDDAPDANASALAAAGIRELWEETGQVLAAPGQWTAPPPAAWSEFATLGVLPNAAAMQFVFRAITPPGRPRRFDARFFLVAAEDLVSDPDDFDAASDELSHLQWIALDAVRSFDLPFITQVVLAEVTARVQDRAPPRSVPFFRNDDEESLFLRLYGGTFTD